jgi:hypothetical protein
MFLAKGSTKLSCARGLPGLPNLEIDMTSIYIAENRIHETSFITPQKSPELTSLFNKTISELYENIVMVDYEVSQAATNVDKIEATILIDKASETLKKKGLSNSADMREAVVKIDPEYQDAMNRLQALKAMSALLKGKLESFKRAYFDAKDIIKLAGIESSVVGKIPLHNSTFDEDFSKMD